MLLGNTSLIKRLALAGVGAATQASFDLRQKRMRIRGRAYTLVPILLAGLAGGTFAFAPGATENAKANGDTRTIYLHHAHTQESISATYMVDGRYDSSVLEKLNWFLRDWRRDEPTHMDARLFDVIWTVYRESGSAQPIEVMSAYRSPETNAMLRRRSRLVAEHSQHILGKAMDQHYVDVPMSRIREIAMKLQRGGVGFYPTAGTPFVHMDVGGVRHWPRMSYDQLARLFPDGKTVHIPSNGQPLAHYEEARAELEARGDDFNYPTATEVKSKGFFAWLFGGGSDDEDEAGSARSGAGRRGAQRVASLDPMVSGSIGQQSVNGLSGKDAGVHAFTMAAAAPPSVQPSSSYGRLQPKREAPVQAPAPVQQAALEQPAPADDTQAQRMLAQAMAKQEAIKEAQAAVPEPPAAAKPLPAPLPLASETDPTVVPSVPMPPRRPIELASAGPNTPLPPGRPPELASLAALAPRAPTKDAITALLGPVSSHTAGLPAAITRGVEPQKPPIQVLAFASPAGPSGSTPQIAVPIPLPRPSFVAARLDRSNFRSLTGKADTTKTPVRSGMGSTVGALRSAAKSNIGALVGQETPGAIIGFGTRATDLATDHFSGSAVKPREHVVTSNGGASATAAE